MITADKLNWLAAIPIALAAVFGAWDCVAVWGGCWALGVGVGWLSTRHGRV